MSISNYFNYRCFRLPLRRRLTIIITIATRRRSAKLEWSVTETTLLLNCPLTLMSRPIVCVNKYPMVRWLAVTTTSAPSNGSTSPVSISHISRRVNGSAPNAAETSLQSWSHGRSFYENSRNITKKRKKNRNAKLRNCWSRFRLNTCGIFRLCWLTVYTLKLFYMYILLQIFET